MRLPRLYFPLMLLAICGCGNNEHTLQRRVVYPASGSITAAGRPLPNASVVLHPVTSPDSDTPFFLPRGTTDEEGKFAISTYEKGDGAPPGTYEVTFSWQGPRREELSEDEQDDLPELLPRQWTRQEQSGVTVVVTEGTNEFEPFQLR